MKKITMALGLFLLGGMLAVPHQVTADSWCWDACRWDGCWEIGAEALYWKPCTCDWEYGVLTESNGSQTAENKILVDSPDYDWGFRILGGYYSSDACSFLTLDWVYLRSTDTVTKSAPEGFDILANRYTFSRTIAKLRTHYNRVNLRGGFYLYRGCDISFFTYGGVRWVEIEEKRKIHGIQTSDVLALIHEKADFWGLGIEVGVGASYHLGCDFYLNGNIGGTTALGERRHRSFDQREENNPLVRVVKSPTRTICVPGVDFRLGISYTYDCNCVSLTGEIGYEHTTYFDALILQRSALFTGTTNPAPELVCANWGVGGPFVSFKLRF